MGDTSADAGSRTLWGDSVRAFRTGGCLVVDDRDTSGNYIRGKVIVVTGAGSGFGRVTSQLAGSLGASIVATDLDGDAAAATAESIVAGGGQAEGVAADVVQKADMDHVAQVAVDRFGAIDVLVNNAGVMPLAFFADHERAWEAWDRCVDINLKGVVHGIAAVYDRMIEQGRGHIVNVSSIYGNRGTAGSGVYSATKAAVVVISDALRVEAQGRIKVTVVRPTGVPGTNLASSVVNFEASVGIAGQNAQRFAEHAQQRSQGTLPAEALDPDHVAYWALKPEELAAQIVGVINTPWGVNISDITVRATGEDYIL
jgi:NADP-dependent 3-hydroxy acid dehydrogenase YdfG